MKLYQGMNTDQFTTFTSLYNTKKSYHNAAPQIVSL